MSVGLHNYMRGSVRCTVRGLKPERFLNKCAEHGVGFWDITYVSVNELRLSMAAADYRAIRPVARESGCTLRHHGKRGALYGLRRVRRRYALLTGAVLLILFLWAMNSLILSIEVTGYRSVTPAEILAALQEEGVGIGTPVKEVDAERLRNTILLKIPKLSWFTVTIKGSLASVDVRERDDTPVVPDSKTPADIIASRDGVITMMRIYRGEAVVITGAFVKKDDLLVSGYVPLRQEGKSILVHSSADIWARVWHQVTVAMPQGGESKFPTGKTRVRFALALGNIRINFYNSGRKPFDKYDKISTRYDAVLTDGTTLPFSLIREEYTEYETYYSPKNAEEESEALILRARELLSRDGVEGAVTNLGLSAWVSEGVVYVRATGESVGKIGVEVPRN